MLAAVNPIAEECFRDCEFEINETMLDEVVTDAEPWIDFWRDNYAFVASRVAAGLLLALLAAVVFIAAQKEDLGTPIAVPV